MDLSEIRRSIVVAVASDDVLVDLLVLKGGNALELIHQIGERASMDLDYSLRGDLDDVEEIARRLFSALRRRFALAGYTVFDERFEPRPRREIKKRWGGYVATFKLINTADFLQPEGTNAEKTIERMRRSAVTSDLTQGRVFTIELSKYEYCEGAERATIDNYDFVVYTPVMIAAEKLRAICQQMPGQRSNPTPRPRDFYDIHAIVTHDQRCAFDTEELKVLVDHMFGAKTVPLRLLEDIPLYREFHRQAWPSVVNLVRGQLSSFDFYFDFVATETRKLESLWVIDPPR